MLNLVAGAIGMAILFYVIGYLRSKGVKLSWFQWSLTILEILYIVFVLTMISAFLAEGNLRAALMMGLIFGFIAILTSVMLFRFVINKSLKIEDHGK